MVVVARHLKSSKIKIVTKRNKINFNKKLYHREAVDRAIKVFKGLAVFQVKENKKKIAVFLAAKLREENISDEFANYVLAETISKKT